MEAKKYTMDLAGHQLSLEFGKYCEQTAGSVWVSLDDTVVMVNATMSPVARPGVDFFPLAVDVEEKQYSVGKIPGGFIKREGRPTEKATLTCRLIDRPLRPLFPKGMRNDVQVVATILSVDKMNPPEIPAMIGSSIALAVSFNLVFFFFIIDLEGGKLLRKFILMGFDTAHETLRFRKYSGSPRFLPRSHRSEAAAL